MLEARSVLIHTNKVLEGDGGGNIIPFFVAIPNIVYSLYVHPSKFP